MVLFRHIVEASPQELPPFSYTKDRSDAAHAPPHPLKTPLSHQQLSILNLVAKARSTALCSCKPTFTSRSPTLSREVRDGFKGADDEEDASSAPGDAQLVFVLVLFLLFLLLLFLSLVEGDGFLISSFSCKYLRFPIALSSRSASATKRRQ